MPDTPKIGVVHGDQSPQIFSDLAPEACPWRLYFFHEQSILGSPDGQHRDFLAVFFSYDKENPDKIRRVATLFPGAEIIGFRNPGETPRETILNTRDKLLVVQFPITFSFAQHLIDSLTLARDGRQELSLLKRRADELTEFLDSFVSIVESSWNVRDRKLAINLLINKILSRVGAEECVIYGFDEQKSKLKRVYCAGNITDLELFDSHTKSPVIEDVFYTGVPHIDNNYSLELRVPFSRESVKIHCILCVPLHRKGEKLGVIEVLNKTNNRKFTQEDQNLLQMLVNSLAVAMKTITVFERSERLTITDDLTKLYNYRYLMQHLESEVRRSLRHKKKISILFIDIDGFKRINDTFGHLVGSKALSEMGQVFRGILRETDIIGRYGGDEFVIVLPETPLNGAMVIAERIRKKVEDYEFASQHFNIRLTVSLGVANLPKHTLTAEGLIKKADAAMYRAKEISKNSIKVAV